jgi:hypothetical protein
MQIMNSYNDYRWALEAPDLQLSHPEHTFQVAAWCCATVAHANQI